jgi:hypothetical protein
MDSASPKRVDRLLTWLAQSASTRMPTIRAIFILVGLLFWVSFVLFPFLVISTGLHWWHLPWSDWLTLAFIKGMAVTTTALALAYVFFVSPMFFLALSHGKISSSGSSLLFKKFCSLAVPYLLIVIAIWSDSYLVGYKVYLLSEIGLSLYILFYVGAVLVLLSQIRRGIRKARQSAA